MGREREREGRGSKRSANNKYKLSEEEKEGAYDNMKWIIHKTHCPSRFPQNYSYSHHVVHLSRNIYKQPIATPTPPPTPPTLAFFIFISFLQGTLCASFWINSMNGCWRWLSTNSCISVSLAWGVDISVVESHCFSSLEDLTIMCG